MTNLLRVKVDLSGFQGGPGCNVLHFSAGLTESSWTQGNVDWVYDELHALYDANKAVYVDDVTIKLPPVADEIDSASGNIIGVQVPTDAPVAIQGTGAGGNSSRGTCVTVALATDIYRDGRRLRGRMFMGPAQAGIMDQDGQVESTTVDAIVDRFTALTSGTGPRLAVFHRPVGSASTGGFYGDVVQVTPRLKPGNLRSRRD